jgi:hypothetical protein
VGLARIRDKCAVDSVAQVISHILQEARSSQAIKLRIVTNGAANQGFTGFHLTNLLICAARKVVKVFPSSFNREVDACRSSGLLHSGRNSGNSDVGRSMTITCNAGRLAVTIERRI